MTSGELFNGYTFQVVYFRLIIDMHHMGPCSLLVATVAGSIVIIHL